MPPINTLPCEQKCGVPTWCDVYLNGVLTFKDVLVCIRQPHTLHLYNSYSEFGGHYLAKDTHLVAVVQSDNYWIVARKQQKT